MSPSTPETPSPSLPPVPEPPARLVREWTACALVRAATRFLPVPVLDDAVAGRATRLAVQRTLRHHGRTYPASAVAPLYADRSRRLGGRVLRRVLLFPVRKWTRVAGAVTGVPTDIGRVLLLGRATHRRLALGGLAGPDPAALAAEATTVRRAFDVVEGEMDLRLLRGAVADSLRQVGDLTGAVTALARRRFSSDAPEEPSADDGEVTDGEVTDGEVTEDEVTEDGADPVAEGTRNVEQALRRPDVVELLAEFDRRMDARVGTG